MGKLTQGILEELTAYFHGEHGGDAAIVAQSYEPRGSGYDPATDARLARLVLRRRTNQDWARVRRVIDELAAPVVEVLRLAVVGGGVLAVAACLPSALAQGRELAIAQVRERELDFVFAVAVKRGLSPMTCAMRVLEADVRIRNVHVTPREIERATELAVRHGQIDVEDEATAVVDQAVDAYVAARDALKATKRAAKAERERERQALLDEALGKKRRKERERFEAKLRRAS